jgi:uridine kinase
MTSWLVIGVSGVTCGGKTTLAKKIHTLYPNNAMYVNMDAYFLGTDDPRHIRASGLNHTNWELITAVDTEKWKDDISKILELKNIPKDTDINEPVPNFSLNTLDSIKASHPIPHLQHKLLILDGIHALHDQWTASQCNLKLFITLTKEQCRERRTKREYDPADIPGYFEACVWPEHVSTKNKVISDNPDLILVDGFKTHVENLDLTLQCIAECDAKLT